ncbi:SGNH/GDSL hydrolase family protein [Magnetovibrio sp.]|uniref:SGNH/GDSL hydrolase family protein n=1 Tax=Magnetovibrio sp. TaxID=2024836 RepID=UPI002F92B323
MNNSDSKIANTLLIVFSLIFSTVVSEFGYRFYLNATQPEKFIQPVQKGEHPSVWYFNDSPWLFDREFGYSYPPGVFDGGNITDGRVVSCWDWTTNERGNIGRIKGDYDSAKLKVLVFGDSWTAQQRKQQDGTVVAWPNYLQDKLEKQLGTSVHVVNFGRDGTGLLHMFDQAKAKVAEWKPDIVVFAFITDDLTRDRFWRTKTVLNGKDRIMTTMIADPNPDYTMATDTAIMHPKATKEWCQARMADKATNDPIVRELEELYVESRERSSLRADLFSMNQSFLFDRLVHGNAFHTNFAQAQPSQNPRHKMRDFRQDERLKQSVDTMKQLGIPWIAVHFAIYPELKADAEFIASDQDKALLQSLRALNDGRTYDTLDYVEQRPVKNPERYSGSFPSDHHPSLAGMEFYADVVANVLIRNGYVRTSDGN